jgi:hypothetical protein
MPLDDDPLSRVAPLPRTLVHSRLFRQSNARRLFKARHLELEQIDLRTRIVSVIAEEGVAPITVYSILMRHRSGSHSARRDSADNVATRWVLEHRYSEFFAFRRRLLKLIHQWEASADVTERDTKEFLAMSNALRRPITSDFPRRRLRLETMKVIKERCVGLQEFTHKLLTAYVDVSVYLLECAASMSHGSHTEMVKLAQELEAFLCVPESQKELERDITAAIRALTDIDERCDPETCTHANECDGYECCICMTSEVRQDAVDRVPGGDKLVQLPCTHRFHEDCVIDWFSTSMTCPLCRQDTAHSG